MRAGEREHLVTILGAVRVPDIRMLPGEAQRAAHELARGRPPDVAGVVALIDFAHTTGYVDALADVDALAAPT